MNYFIQRTDTSLRYTTVMLISPINAVPGWVALAQDRRAWADVVRQFCDIPKVPTPKDERLLDHIAGRPYAVHFRKKDEEQQGGANAAAAGHAAGAPAFESEFDRLARIGN